MAFKIIKKPGTDEDLRLDHFGFRHRAEAELAGRSSLPIFAVSGAA